MISLSPQRALLSLEFAISGNLPRELSNRRRLAGGSRRVLLARPLVGPSLNWSSRRLNALARGLHADRYLEIGVEYGYTLENVRVQRRVGVDPAPRFELSSLPGGIVFHELESDVFFAALDESETFDLAFLDGLHTFEQTTTDLFNTLRHVPHGVALIDDTFPPNALAGLPELEESLSLQRDAAIEPLAWMGDVWKLVVLIDRYLPQLDFRTIVGGGNVQTLVWRRDHDQVIDGPSEAEMAEIETLSYDSVFTSGLPPSFRPSSERAAIVACLRATR